VTSRAPARGSRPRRAAALGALLAIFTPKGERGDLVTVLRVYLAALEDLPDEALEAAVVDLSRTWTQEYGRSCPTPADIREAARARAVRVAERIRAQEEAAELRRLERDTMTPAELRAHAAELDARATSTGPGVTLVWAVIAGFLRSAARSAETGIGRPKGWRLAPGKPGALRSGVDSRGTEPPAGRS
jgi:hypothetical protein